MFSSTYIVSLLVSISMAIRLYFLLAKMVIFLLNIQEIRKNMFSTIPPLPNK